MTWATALDVALGLVLLLYAVSGFRMGLLVGAFSLVGFLAGGFVGLTVLPRLLELWPWAVTNEFASRLLLVAGVFIFALVGQRLLVKVGSRLRSRVTAPPVRAVDAVLGAAASLLAVALLVWVVADGLRGATTTPPLARAIGGSRVLQAIDSLIPPQAGNLFAGFREMLAREGFPRVFEGLGREPIAPAAPPSSGIAAAPAVVKASASVVKVTGVAEACQRGQEGSGWVVARERVVTNAHVVAGIEQPTVQAEGSRLLRGRVVIFDPSKDLAVIAVPGLQAPALPLNGDLARGAEAAVAGFPLDGPLRVDPARVRDTVNAVGSDIYGRPGVRREIYSLYTRVEPGNSGGPLITGDGAVVGVVFAKSVDDDQTGYALTMDEARPVLAAAAGAGAAVPTGACTTD